MKASYVLGFGMTEAFIIVIIYLMDLKLPCYTRPLSTFLLLPSFWYLVYMQVFIVYTHFIASIV